MYKLSGEPRQTPFLYLLKLVSEIRVGIWETISEPRSTCGKLKFITECKTIALVFIIFAVRNVLATTLPHAIFVYTHQHSSIVQAI